MVWVLMETIQTKDTAGSKQKTMTGIFREQLEMALGSGLGGRSCARLEKFVRASSILFQPASLTMGLLFSAHFDCRQSPIYIPDTITMQHQQLTANEIPCCLCGTLILPNAANQCSTCLAQNFDLHDRLQRGPSGAHQITIHQCRECRRFAKTPKFYQHAAPESPELLAICLQHIPALSSSSDLHLVDAAWIWTEPHSMRFKLRLTVRTILQNVPVQQRVQVELHNRFQQCPDCNREFTNRTWHARVQLRQRRPDEKKGLAVLEQALAKNETLRKHVLKLDTTKDGLDFYFLTLAHAQALVSYLSKVAALRTKTSQKLVSEDNHNNTANMKYTILCELVPLCKHDLVLLDKSVRHRLSGTLALVTKVSGGGLQFVPAAAERTLAMVDVGPEAYYKAEKAYRVVGTPKRAVRFVVLDVELVEGGQQQQPIYAGPQSGVSKYAMADVQVVREADLGVRDDGVLHCVTHLGHLLQAGDVVLGYDLTTTSLLLDGDEDALHHGYVVPDVVLFQKVVGGGGEGTTQGGEKPTTTKKRERRRRRREDKKTKKLEESAVRMGFLAAEEDPELAEELSALEAQLAGLDTENVAGSAEDDVPEE